MAVIWGVRSDKAGLDPADMIEALVTAVLVIGFCFGWFTKAAYERRRIEQEREAWRIGRKYTKADKVYDRKL
jgi:hypothetical protein